MASAPEIPLDIREAMHDVILAIFWPKNKIIEFLLSVGCPQEFVPASDTQMSRHAIVVDAFSRLSSRPDRGHGVFQTMIDRLSNWSYFDPYYFDKLAKLDRKSAQENIRELKKAVQNRNSSTLNQRASTVKANQKERINADLSALSTAFTKVFGSGMSPQARGRLFETFLKELFNRQSVKMGDAFRLNGEQIDGSFKFEGENYIVEAKWQDPSTSTSDLYTFAHKVDGKMHGRGLFVSVNGFSHEGIRAIVHGKMIKTILMDGEDLSHVLEQRLSLEALLDYKIRAAQTRGEVYVCALRETSKI